jgi:uncharacterized SAM-binding protein YcdF (DUF218 family)
MKKNQYQAKYNLYKRLIGFHPEAIILLSGGMIKEVGKDGVTRYRSTRVDEGDSFGVLWGEARTLAVAELSKFFPKAMVLITGIATRDTSTPTICEELEKLLISRDRIILENKSTNTLLQILEVMKIIDKRKIRKLVVVTNEYHTHRARAIYENFESLGSLNYKTKLLMRRVKNSGISVKFIGAEIVLPHRDTKYIRIINDMKESFAYRKRVKNEKRGLLMIKNGKYGLKATASIDKSERSLE